MKKVKAMGATTSAPGRIADQAVDRARLYPAKSPVKVDRFHIQIDHMTKP
jgi:hypothetical protein